MDSEIISKVNELGWAYFNTDLNENLESICSEFGRIVPSKIGGPDIDILTIKSQGEAANKNSLSGIYGAGSFPYHTDCAKFKIPPRYIILRMKIFQNSSRNTLLISMKNFNLSEGEREILERDIWYIDGGRGKFYTPLINKNISSRSPVFRFDINCMRPTGNGRSLPIIEKHIRLQQPIEIDWMEKNTLIIDNWSMLHARSGESNTNSEVRILERALLEEK